MEDLSSSQRGDEASVASLRDLDPELIDLAAVRLNAAAAKAKPGEIISAADVLLETIELYEHEGDRYKLRDTSRLP